MILEKLLFPAVESATRLIVADSTASEKLDLVHNYLERPGAKVRVGLHILVLWREDDADVLEL